jgi:hypothetical protein
VKYVAKESATVAGTNVERTSTRLARKVDGPCGALPLSDLVIHSPPGLHITSHTTTT